METQLNAFDSNKPILLKFDKNNAITPDSNVSWVVWNGKKHTVEPMQLSYFLKYGNYNGTKVMNYAISKGEQDESKYIIYFYSKGVYKKIASDELKGMIRLFIPQDLRSKKVVDEVYADLISSDKFVTEEDFDKYEYLINFQDGMFDIKSKQLLPHDPKYMSTVQIPAKYKDIQAAPNNAPVFDNYLNTLLNGDDHLKEILLECIGLILSNIEGSKTKTALFLVGEGNTGKSQIKKVVEELLGSKNYSSIDMKDLHNRFGKAAIHGKRLVGCNDMSYKNIEEMDTFKQITGGDSISLEFKFGATINYRYRGFVWFNCNNLPTFGGDKGEWVYARMLPIVCKNVIPKEKRDPMLFDKMMLEKNTIIKKALEALDRLIEKNFDIERTEEMKQILKRYETTNNTLLSFISECCVTSAETNVKTKRSTFNKCYDSWCKINNSGKGKLGINAINDTLKAKYGEEYRKSNGIFYMDKLAIMPNVMEELGVYDGNQEV